MLIRLNKSKSNIILFALIFIFITANSHSKNGYGDLKMNSEVSENFIDYITGVGMDKVGLRKGTPHYFAINNEGNASYYFFCPLKYSDNCDLSDWTKVRKECSKRSKDFGGKKCSIFANKRKIVWGSKNFTFPKNPDREYVINKLKDLGFINETSLAETFDKTNPDIVEKFYSLKKLYDAGALSKKDYEKAKKKILD
jgi:hypothetical protein